MAAQQPQHTTPAHNPSTQPQHTTPATDRELQLAPQPQPFITVSAQTDGTITIDKSYPKFDIVNMKTQTVSTRLTQQELRVLDELAEGAGLDRSGMTRSLLRRGLKEMRTEAALKAYAGQHATLSRAAEMAELSSWDFLARLATTGETLHYDLEEFEEDLDAKP